MKEIDLTTPQEKRFSCVHMKPIFLISTVDFKKLVTRDTSTLKMVKYHSEEQRAKDFMRFVSEYAGVKVERRESTKKEQEEEKQQQPG